MKNFINCLIIAAAIMTMAAGCAANKVTAPAKLSSGEIEIPYKGLGGFVAKDGTLDQAKCWEEVDRQNNFHYEISKRESESEFSWKKCSIYSAVFFAIKENYWDKKEGD